MITFLEIENILLIKKTTIEFTKGLCVFTGETGAGKSIILNSILFLLGKKIKTESKYLIREGEERGHITGAFEVKHNASLVAFLSQKGFDIKDEFILKRAFKKGEKEKTFLNGNLISTELLTAIGNHILEVNRQNEQINLLQKSWHLKMLDLYGETGGDLSILESEYKNLINIQNQIKSTNDLLNQFKNDKEYLENLVNEIETLNLLENEEEELINQKITISKALKEVEAVNICAEKIFHEKNLRSTFISALKKLRAEEHENAFEVSINNILNEMDILEDLLNSKSRESEYTETHLDKINERIFLIKDIARKYKVPSTELNQFLQSQKNILNQINFNDENIKKLLQQESEHLEYYNTLCHSLSEKRKSAAIKLEEIINSEFNDLEMNGANFKVLFKEKRDCISALGFDDVEFIISTNKGIKHASLSKVASGGELSRILLAMKIALLKANTVNTIIFDEIDSGIGGKTSNAVANKLIELSKKIQIILVTHQAQIASKATLHLKIEKKLVNNVVQTDVITLNSVDREGEIARMLSGNLTRESIENAKSMLK